MHLTEFRELWFPSPRIRLPELGPAGPVFIEGGRCISAALGEYTKLWILAAGRWHFYYTHPAPRDFSGPPCRRPRRTCSSRAR